LVTTTSSWTSLTSRHVVDRSKRTVAIACHCSDVAVRCTSACEVTTLESELIRDRNVCEGRLVHNEPLSSDMVWRSGNEWTRQCTNSTFQFIQRPRRHAFTRPLERAGLSLAEGPGSPPPSTPKRSRQSSAIGDYAFLSDVRTPCSSRPPVPSSDVSSKRTTQPLRTILDRSAGSFRLARSRFRPAHASTCRTMSLHDLADRSGC